jgi:hypothetical protein
MVSEAIAPQSARVLPVKMQKELTMLKKLWHALLASAALVAATGAHAQAATVTVVEYYNRALDAYFITGRVAEQQQLDLVADFKRTGMTFEAVAAADAGSTLARVCRFYISSSSPFTSSHFYGRDNVDCNLLLARNDPAFTWEGYDFALRQPAAGVCPSDSVAVTRSFRAAANGKTPNHRYSVSAASVAAAAQAGYAPEEVAFCAAAATDVTPAVLADCGSFFYSGQRVTYESLSTQGFADRWTRRRDDTPVSFNGQPAIRVIDEYASGLVRTTMMQEAATEWTDLGFTTVDASSGLVERFYLPATTFSRKMMANQRIDFSRTMAFRPIQTYGSANQVGYRTWLGREKVSVPAGNFDTCVFDTQIVTTYTAAGLTLTSRTTSWVADGVGVVKFETREATGSSSQPPSNEIITEGVAVTVQPL